MSSLFGTDGVRGIVNADLTPELATMLARAAASRVPPLSRNPSFLVGRDTRLSGGLLEAAVVAGLCSGGADVIVGGVMPTPVLSYLVRSLDLEGGIMISASHNTYEWNGLKFFGPGGEKLSAPAEREIERLLEAPDDAKPPASVGTVQRSPDLLSHYLAHLGSTAGRRLEGLRVVLDCAHGALWELAPRALEALGADVIAINCRPNGRNINDGGVVKPKRLARAVRERSAHVGLAFDGDGDRLTVVDERGVRCDGDQILALWANDLAARGQLPGNAVVGTVITNGGLERFLTSIGCRLLRTPVGDRHVSAEMRETGAILGGETCGHIIFAPHLSNSDALYTGLAVLSILAGAGRPLSELTSAMQKRPQVSFDVPAPGRPDLQADPVVLRAVEEAERALGDGGWILVRPSGTEPVIRVTAECDDEDLARRVAADTASALQQCLSERRPSNVDIAA